MLHLAAVLMCFSSHLHRMDAYHNSPPLAFLQQQEFEFDSAVFHPLRIADCELWSCRLGWSHHGGSLHDVDVDLVATTVIHPEAAGI